MIKLGSKVRDTITGYTGIAVSRTEWLNGCVRWGVQAAAMKDGVPVDAYIVDEPQLELVEETEKPAAAPRHGGRPDIPRAAVPSR